jgi:hypothetical protein
MSRTAIAKHTGKGRAGRRYAAFDIETAKLLPDDVTDLLAHRPLGVACAAAFLGDTRQTRLWHGRDRDENPSPRMSRAEAAALVRDLSDLVGEGYTLLTWNGLGFDFDVLAEESGSTRECADLALHHVDALFHALCTLGYPLSLQKASEGMNLPGKLAGMSGSEAPSAWAAGRYADVLKYVAQDVRATFELAVACEERRELAWITRRGTRRYLPLNDGWLTVGDARLLPVPDTSWMNDPPDRERYTAWADEVCPPTIPPGREEQLGLWA